MVAAVGLSLWTVAGGAADANVDWPAYAGDKASTKYSPLDQINRTNIKGLAIAWRRSGLPEELRPVYPDAQAPANYQHTPLVVGGLLYMSTAVGVVTALDPATGKTVWYDTLPPLPDGQGPTRGGPTRGLAYWTDGRESRGDSLRHARVPAHRARREDRTGRHDVRRQRSRRSEEGQRPADRPAQSGEERTRDRAQAVVSAAAERGLQLLSCGLYGNVIRLLPPLNMSAEDLGEGLSILEESLGA